MSTGDIMCKHGMWQVNCGKCFEENVIRGSRSEREMLEPRIQHHIDAETMRLAKLVAKQPPLPHDENGIEEWANKLAHDITENKLLE